MQEPAWYDQVNYTEMSSKIARECQAIQNSIGEKSGAVTMAIASTISGLVVGMVRGWAISLCILGIAPFIALSTVFYGKALSGGLSTGLQAYSQSAGYAE